MEPGGSKKLFRFSEVQILDNSYGENRSPEGRRKRKTLAKKRSNQRAAGIAAILPCAEVTKKVEAINNRAGQIGENEVSARCREEGQLSLAQRQGHSETAEQVPIRQLATCFSVDSGHGDDLSSSWESGTPYLQAANHQDYSSDQDEDVFEDARSCLDDAEARSDSDGSTYLTPRSQSLADIPSLDDCTSLVGGEMDLCSEATGSGATGFGDTRMLPTHLDQLTLNRSEGSTSFTVVSSEDTPPTGKVWDSLLQKPLPPCPSYSPQDSAISSSSPQSTINSPFSFPMTSSPSPPLSQTTPIYCQDEWPDLSMQVETTKVPSFSTEAAGFEPPITHQPALPGKLEIHKLIEAPSGMDEWPGIEANHDRHGNQSLCPDSSPNPLPQCATRPSNLPHSLHCAWVMWFDRCVAISRNGLADYQLALDHLSSVQCIEDFWRVYNNLEPPSKLANANYHFFKENIRPLWEDPFNCHGGKWVLTFNSRNSSLDKVWEELLLRLISGEMINLEDITGAVVSRRKRGDRISLWTSSQEESKVVAVCRELIQVLLIACDVPSTKTKAFICELADGGGGLQLAYLLHEDSLKTLKSYHNKAHITVKDHLSEFLRI